MRRRSGSAVLLLSPTNLDESKVAHVLVSQIVASIITLVEACQGARGTALLPPPLLLYNCKQRRESIRTSYLRVVRIRDSHFDFLIFHGFQISDEMIDTRQ